jgi:dolichol-phosphate mannosyltransferase
VSSLLANLVEMERTRESYWRRYPATSPVKLHWRALTVRHCFHLLPGESVLEIGAGSGLWTEHLVEVCKGTEVTAAVFNDDLASAAEERGLRGARVVRVNDLLLDLPTESFDYVVGTAILCHDRYGENLSEIHRLLKPGGQILFFEANFWNPQVLLKNTVPGLGRRLGQASCQVGMRRYRLMEETSRRGFIEVTVLPYDIVHPRTPPALISSVQSIAFVLEHVPGVRDLSGTLYIWARKPGDAVPPRRRVDLVEHEQLIGSTSVVVPCHDEAMNIPGLVHALLDAYDRYIHEIVLVDDNSTDGTTEVAKALAATEPRIKLVTRTSDPGVGRALRDGYRAATGDYILSMDCDFAMIVPELRDLFDAVAAGRDGAIGSRFSHDSILINYPVKKILGNRAFHLLARVLLRRRGMRDISNNLKLYRASILKDMEIEQPGLAANVETGLKPWLAGNDIVEVPISWINRTPTMGSSSFELLKVAPGYARALAQLVRDARLRRDRRRE